MGVSISRKHRLDPNQLYRKYAPLVLRRALRFFSNEHEAEEIVHEVFLKVLERSDQFLGESAPSTWLYQITTRHCLSKIRDQKRRRELLDQHGPAWSCEPMQDDPDSTLFLKQLWKELDQELIVLCTYYYIDGLTHEEIGKLLGCSGRTIGNRLQEIREKALRLKHS